MQRRLKLSPLQRDVMVTLEEAGAETIGTLIATIRPDDILAFSHVVNMNRRSLGRTEAGSPLPSAKNV